MVYFLPGTWVLLWCRRVFLLFPYNLYPTSVQHVNSGSHLGYLAAPFDATFSVRLQLKAAGAPLRQFKEQQRCSS